MIMSDRLYDTLKGIQRILLPALATLYIGFGEVWAGVIALPYPAQIAATITLIDTFLGVMLGISASNYNKIHEASVDEADGQ